MDINRIILSGRLTKDPELRYTPNGIAVCNFTLATDRPFTNAQGKRETDFHTIIVWRQQAETVANYLRKGQEATVDGRLQNRSYQNNEGRNVTVTEIIAENVKFGQLPKGQNSQSHDQSAVGRGRSQDQGSNDPFYGAGQPIDIQDDDLPF